jgi:hypothetical protein
MSEVSKGRPVDENDPPDDFEASNLYDVLASRRRRAVLAIVLESAGSVTVDELTDRLRERLHRGDGSGTTDVDHEELRRSLERVHLPVLVSAGLLRREAARTAVTGTPRLADLSADLEPLLPVDDDHPPEEIRALLSTLTQPRRRLVLGLLRESAVPVQLAELADRLAEWEGDGSDAVRSDEHRARMLADLRHIQLPRLLELDLVTYDPADHTVSYRGHPLLAPLPPLVDAGPVTAEATRMAEERDPDDPI